MYDISDEVYTNVVSTLAPESLATYYEVSSFIAL